MCALLPIDSIVVEGERVRVAGLWRFLIKIAVTGHDLFAIVAPIKTQITVLVIFMVGNDVLNLVVVFCLICPQLRLFIQPGVRCFYGFCCEQLFLECCPMINDASEFFTEDNTASMQLVNVVSVVRVVLGHLLYQVLHDCELHPAHGLLCFVVLFLLSSDAD